MITEYESFRRKLISRNLPAVPVELPDGYVALFASEPGDAANHAHLFLSNGQEAAAPLISFTDDADFSTWIDGLREAVQRNHSTVEEYWRKRAVIIGQADENRHTRKTVTEIVHGEIDVLVERHVLTPARGETLKARLTPSVIEQHVRDGLTTRDIIELHNQKGIVSPDEQFAGAVLTCVEELNAVLERFAGRYEDLVIVAALAEHMGSALRLFMENGICNSGQARRVLKHIEGTAFSSEESEQERDKGESGIEAETPFRITISLNPYLATPVVVERDLTHEEALTFLSSIWDGLEEAEPTNERPAEYLARVGAGSRECVTVCDSKFRFELFRNAGCEPPTVRLDLPKVPTKRQ